MRVIQQIRPHEIYNLAAQKPRRGVVRRTRIHRQFGCPRRAAPPGGDTHSGICGQDPLLPGLHVGAFRQSAARRRKARLRHSIHARPTTPSPNYMRIGSRSIIVKPMACSRATASCSTMNRRCAAKPSSRARSRARWRASSSGLQDCVYPRQSRSQTRLGTRDAYYVEAQGLMLQQDRPEDFVSASGGAIPSVRDFVNAAAMGTRQSSCVGAEGP